MSDFVAPEKRFPANIVEFENGLRVIHQQLTHTPVVVTDVWVHAGTRSEPEGWWGIAHFLEHLIFKGSKRIPPGWFDSLIENLGGMANAETSYDYAHFFLTSAKDYWGETLPYFAELLLQAEIPEEAFHFERHVVLEEIRQTEDDPDSLALQALCESLYNYHPYGRSILGTEEDIWNRSPNQLRCFHRTYYQPYNMTVVIVGDISKKMALEGVEAAFHPFSVPSECPPLKISPPPILHTPQRREIRLPRLEISRLVIGWRCVGIEGWEEAVGLDLLSVFLAQGTGSRLVRELREEKQLVYEIGSSFSLQQDSSLFTINVWLPQENLATVEQLICDRIFEISSKPIPSKEIDRAKRLLINDYIFSTETPEQLAGLYGYYSTLTQVELSLTYPQQIQRISSELLQHLGNTYLSPERYGVTVMKPF